MRGARKTGCGTVWGARRAPPGADEASRASGRNIAIGKRQGRADRADVATGMSAPRKVKLNIEMWLSLVERYVRDSITTLGVEFSRRAENP